MKAASGGRKKGARCYTDDVVRHPIENERKINFNDDALNSVLRAVKMRSERVCTASDELFLINLIYTLNSRLHWTFLLRCGEARYVILFCNMRTSAKSRLLFGGDD